MRRLYASVTGIAEYNLLDINVGTAHDGACSIANITCINTDLIIGDEIAIDLGYVDDHEVIFRGYVKIIKYSVPDKVYVITANDKMVRAMDFFIVAPNVEEPYKYRNISGESLVKVVMDFAGFTAGNYVFDTTYFTFATGEKAAEINLTSSYDYAKNIADLLAWNLWMEENYMYFCNRKPFVMDGSLSQPGDPPYGLADTNPLSVFYTGYTLETEKILSLSLDINERDLRNKVVVYGNKKLSATAQSALSLDPLDGQMKQILPNGFYKAVVLSSDIITDQNFAQLACNYNLALFNRLTYEIDIQTEGVPQLTSRRIITLNQNIITSDANRDWYIFRCDHYFNRNGYTTKMILRI